MCIRYGWSHAEGKDELLKKTFGKASVDFPWVKAFQDRSITELEIRHAVLNNPASETAKRALFFIKGDVKSDSERLDQLKATIRNAHTTHSYDSPQQLAEIALENLKQRIDKDFPAK